jgi:hypothetical protein
MGGASNTFTFNITHNDIGSDQLLSIDIENPATTEPNPWTELKSYQLDTLNTREVTISNVQDYIDTEGYVSLRARWVGFGETNQLEIYEISRVDPFFIGPKTTLGDEWDYYEQNALDGDSETSAGLYYSWGELDRYEFLHVQAYTGDASTYALSIEASLYAAPSAPVLEDAELIVEGENEPDKWSLIHRFIINDALRMENINLLNTRQYVNAQGYLSLRIRWEADSVYHDARIHEISKN